MSEDKERQQAQKGCEFLVLDSVWYFLEQHRERATARRILYRSYGEYTQGTEIMNGFFILLLKKYNVLGKQDSLWDVYVDHYWPSYKPLDSQPSRGKGNNLGSGALIRRSDRRKLNLDAHNLIPNNLVTI